MDKLTRHEKAEEFRRSIKLPSQRMAQIEEFLQKEQYDEIDELRIKLLFQKTEYYQGCENAYHKLIHKLQSAQKEFLIAGTRLYNYFKIA